MRTIKISQPHATWPFVRQTPGCSGEWGDYTFIINQEVEECDAWVVIGDLLNHRESANCPPNRTILINEEPPTMREYPEKYLSQFTTVATCGGHNFRHSGVKEIFPLQAWYIGINQGKLHAPDKKNPVRITYDDLKAFKPPKKKKLLSVVCSDKKLIDGHIKRHEFVRTLKSHFGDSLDVFGRGFRFVSDKWDAIADYQYHIAIENSCFPHYWTEKLADAYLGWSFPIYYGCPNITDYFDPNSFATIDIASPIQSIVEIERIMGENRWSRNLSFLAEARKKVLDEYNLFPMIIKLLDLPDKSEAKKKIELKSIAVTVGQTRMMLRKTRTKLQIGLGITRIFPFLRKI
jgi:hypothetical protein